MRFRAQMLRHLALLLTFSASVASAHMKINKTAPEEGSTQSKPPEHIQLWFTQAPDLAVSKVELTGPAGDVELGKPQTMDDKSLMAAVTGEAPDGDYTVKWQTAGNDGHIQKGGFAFKIERAE